MVLEIFTVYLVMFILQCFVWNLIKFALSVIWILFYLEEDYDVQKLVLLAVILQHRLDTDPQLFQGWHCRISAVS